MEATRQLPTIAFACMGDATDPNYSSGAPWAMRKGFLDLGCNVVDAFPLERGVAPRLPIWKAILRLLGGFYAYNRRPAALDAMARAFRRMTQGKPVDFVFAVHSIPSTRFRVAAPIVFTHDQTFLELLEYFPYEPRPPAPSYVREALAQEREAFANASLCIYPSCRSVETVESAYGVAPEKLAVIPWGANLVEEPARADVEAAIAARAAHPLRLLFIGVDWQRKGGDMVLATCEELERRGVEFSLHIVGCTPSVPVPAWATVVRFLDKERPEDRAEYAALMAAAHFLFVPSRVEAYGHVFCEAAAFGVPAMATNVGGIPAVVIDGKTGRCLPPEAGPAEFADAILMASADRETYRRMAIAARDRFESDLNWAAFCRAVIERVQRMCKPAARAERSLFVQG